MEEAVEAAGGDAEPEVEPAPVVEEETEAPEVSEPAAETAEVTEQPEPEPEPEAEPKAADDDVSIETILADLKRREGRPE